MSAWKKQELGDFLSLEYGKPLDKKNRKEDGLYPVYGANGIKCRSNEYYCDSKSIIVGRKGSAGELTITEDKYWPLDVAYFVRFDDCKYNLTFIYYLLSQLNLSNLATGVKPGINRNRVYEIQVKTPCLQEQQRIVAILNQAFADIEKAHTNTEQNLKNARELFDSYLNQVFNQRGERNHTAMSIWPECKLSDVSETLNGVSEYSGVAVMDWPVMTLGEVCEVIAGQSPKSKFYNQEGNGLPFYQGKKDFGDKYIGEPTSWTEKVTKQAIAGDILMSVRAPVGPINFSSQDCCIGRGLAAIRPSKLVDEDFLFYTLLSKQDEIKGTEGAVFASINKKKIEQLKISLPPIPEQQRIANALENLSKETKKLEDTYKNKLDSLDELKKSLLQKAFSGELTKSEGMVA